METAARELLGDLDGHHWWLRGRRHVYTGLLRHHLGGRPLRDVLDAGCGAGGFLAPLRSLGARVVGADAEPEALRLSAARHAPLVRARCERLPFADASFDLVCLFDVLEHLDDDRAAVREAARVLRPGGLLFASVPAYPFLFSDNDRVSHHRRRYTRRSLARTLDAAPLEIQRLTHANVLLFPLILPTSLLIQAWERLHRGRQVRHTNLGLPLPRVLHELLYKAFAAELPLGKRMDWPAGHSIALLARKLDRFAAHASA